VKYKRKINDLTEHIIIGQCHSRGGGTVGADVPGRSLCRRTNTHCRLEKRVFKQKFRL